MNNDGWIKHDGKPPNLPLGTYVELKYRDNPNNIMPMTIDEFALQAESALWSWREFDSKNDIIEYKVVS